MTPARVSGWLDGFDTAGDGASEKSIELVRMLLEHSPYPFSRNQFTPGHITATACVIHPKHSSFILIYHKRLHRWLMPGGHVEAGDSEVSASAAREAIEETGIALALGTPRLLSVDVHAIPPKRDEPLHLHHDLTFQFQAASEAVVITEETEAVVWATESDFAKYGIAENLQRAVRRARVETRKV